jgi:hypothetical protein
MSSINTGGGGDGKMVCDSKFQIADSITKFIDVINLKYPLHKDCYST